MKRYIKQLNFIFFFLSVGLLFTLESYSHISSSLLSILPQGESKTLIKEFYKSQDSKILFLAIKGFDNKSLAKIEELEESLMALPQITPNYFRETKALTKHLNQTQFLRQDIDNYKLQELNITLRLSELRKEMIDSFIPIEIDKNDPFLLLPQSPILEIKFKNGHLCLGEYGYLTILKLESQNLETHNKLYQNIHTIINKSNIDKKNIKLFSPLFYYVENSQAIRQDVNFIAFFAITILLLLYLILLKELRLLLNTLITLGTSAIVATIFLSLLYKEISIFVFVLGISISTIAIDYMFHHYIHGYYNQKSHFNKNVFLGFFTTSSAFFILSFSSFLLLKQIALFALVSLSISYLHFAWLYPYLIFRPFHLKTSLFKYKGFQIKSLYVFLFSISILGASTLWIEFDFNLKNLDFNNKTLKQSELFFTNRLLETEQITIMIKAKSIDGVIKKAKILQKEISTLQTPWSKLVDSQNIAKYQDKQKTLNILHQSLQNQAHKLGFKENYFQDAYTLPKTLVEYNETILKTFDIPLLHIDREYLGYARVDKEEYAKALKYDFVQSLSLKELFETEIKEQMQNIVFLGLLSLFVILLLLFFITQKSLLYALNFITFPIAVVAIYGYFHTLNILHIFMLFIIVAISIDYAIYLSKENNLQTKQAILYSLLSTFAGFGVLIFSSIPSLYSLGIVATIGVVSIFVLLLSLKGEKNVSSYTS
ncbi:MAG: hypothetical protein QM493_09670 [Sulfurovum sp.]